MNVEQYLKRIGYQNELSVSLECLNELIVCQVQSIPFENLDVFWSHSVPSLDSEQLFRKIITNRRGGYCFELNTLFCELLRTVGFDAFCVRVRILLDREILPPQTHCGILVNLNGETWFCDVGFGGPAPLGAVGLFGAKVCYHTHQYQILGNTLYLWRENSFVPMMEFEDQPCRTLDFVPINYFCATSAEEPFVHRLMVSLKVQEGYRSIDGTIFREKQAGTVTETKLIDKNHVRRILKEKFKIDA